MILRRTWVRVLLALAGLYTLICLAMFLAQERLLFPVSMVVEAVRLPPGAERLSIDTPDGIRLAGVHLPPLRGPGSGTVILSFGGNATNAEDQALRLRRILPEDEIVAFHYRGYPPSEGEPSAQAMIEDAPLIFDLIQRRYHPQRTVAVGVSLGSGIAATLSAKRPLAGLVLVTPYDSLESVAAQHYWWLPVRLLMRHDVDSAAALRGGGTPVAIIAAENDTVVRPERTDALREAIGRLRLDVTLAGAGHNDVFAHPRFAAVLNDAVRRVTDQSIR